MNYNLFLDDIRTPHSAFSYMNIGDYITKDWVIVRNYKDFIKTVELNGVPEIVSFDHDLNDFHYENQVLDYDDETIEKTGYHCAKWLIEYCLENEKEIPQKIIIHSMNLYGSLNIKSLFDTYIKLFDKPTDVKLRPH